VRWRKNKILKSAGVWWLCVQNILLFKQNDFEANEMESGYLLEEQA